MALRPEHLDLISICTGGGGLDLGVELAIPSARSVVLVEREAFAAAQLVSAMQQGLMAPAPVWSDARTFNGRAWRGCVDGLIGGIPCQPHSLAGKRLERADPRDLWSTARRIIVQSGAWFVLIENVEGMLSSGGAERVWRDLGRLGFACEVGLFTAAEVGASHKRERTFILAVADARSGGAIREPGDVCSPESIDRPSASNGAERDAGHGRAGLSGVGQADPYGERLEGQRPDDRASGREDARRSAGLRDRADVEHAAGLGWGEGRTEPELRSGRNAAAGAERDVGNAASAGLHASALAGADRSDESRGSRDAQPQRRGSDVADSSRPERRQVERGRFDDADRQEGRRVEGASGPEFRSHEALFPPGPDDLAGWRRTLDRAPELEPAFRRVADGLASRMDIARVDRLRLLGNGVVPLEAAYAIRVLAERLARRGYDRLWKLCQ